MREPILRVEPKKFDMPPAEFERIRQSAARESVIRNAKLGFPAVSCEEDRIVFTSPEQILAEFAAEGSQPKANSSD